MIVKRRMTMYAVKCDMCGAMSPFEQWRHEAIRIAEQLGWATSVECRCPDCIEKLNAKGEDDE